MKRLKEKQKEGVGKRRKREGRRREGLILEEKSCRPQITNLSAQNIPQ